MRHTAYRAVGPNPFSLSQSSLHPLGSRCQGDGVQPRMSAIERLLGSSSSAEAERDSPSLPTTKRLTGLLALAESAPPELLHHVLIALEPVPGQRKSRQVHAQVRAAVARGISQVSEEHG